MLRNLSHPAVPAYVDSFHIVEDGETTFYLVQELVEGKSLAQLGEEQEHSPALGTRQMLRMVRDIAHVLVYLHGLNPPVVHRDVKPGNIIKRPDGSYALIDFGAVQALVPKTLGGSTFVGTTGYMPPEQMLGRAEPSSDLFALGATAIHMASGFHPADLPVRRLRMVFEPVVDLPEDVVALLRRMIEPDIGDRIASAREVLEEVDRLLAHRERSLSRVARPFTAKWPRVESSPDELLLTFPTMAISAASTMGMLLAMLLASLAAVFQPTWIPLAAAALTAFVSFCVGYARTSLRLTPDKFELKRHRLLLPPIELEGRLSTLRVKSTTTELPTRDGFEERRQFIVTSGIHEELIAPEKFHQHRDQLVEMIERFQEAHDR